MHSVSLGEPGYCETRSNYCFSLFAYCYSKDRILSSKTNLESQIFLGWSSKAAEKKKKKQFTLMASKQLNDT